MAKDRIEGKRKAKADTDNTSRRTWDKAEFKQQAADREKEVRSAPSPILWPNLPAANSSAAQDAKLSEESALDAKRRRRFGVATVPTAVLAPFHRHRT